MHVSAIIAAGGRGTRFGAAVPKQLLTLGGRTILQHSLDAYLAHPLVTDVVVALPAIQAEFGVTRAAASFPYTLTMLGFGVGGIMMGRLSDRYGVRLPLVGATCALAIGYVLASFSSSLLMYALVQGLLIGMLGSSASFGPLLADISHWFMRRRGLAGS
mgnify:CR=1 FL=1